MNEITTKTWRQYESGKEYKRRIGLYDNVRRNERYYRGDQWYGTLSELPRPVFNIIRRIIDYLIGSIASPNIRIRYTDESIPYAEKREDVEVLSKGVELLNGNAAYRWENEKMDSVVYRLMLDAAISGDGVLYCSWDPDATVTPLASGDIRTQTLDNVNLFLADVNRADIQSQEYIILSGRQSVLSLRREAKANGVSDADIKKIVADSERAEQSGDLAEYELEGEDEEKATYLIKFWKENGRVCFEKSTRLCVIAQKRTELRLYPVAYFNWYPTKNSCHGTSPITGLIPNQKFINRAYAMVMKHMTDTAFSKVIYDKTKIPEWSNEVGEAIAAVGGGNISDAVSVVGVGQLQSGYLELITNAIANTKEMMGATETALGNVNPSNTSAILAMQEAARIPLMQIRSAFRMCLEELAAIWADMLCVCFGDRCRLPVIVGGELSTASAELTRLHDSFVRAHVEIGNVADFNLSTTQGMLDRLLEGGHIAASDYLELLPAGLMLDREDLVRRVSLRENSKEELKNE
ncbi:MAG: hypothetical protein E7640_05325 [Ruminococcaceae bacterium]|nr:hypothetical protein [Oscillospiraceae bacterium]